MDTTNISVVKAQRPPRVLPRVLAVIVMVIAVLALVISLGVAIGSWAVKGPAQQSVHDITASVDEKLQKAQTGLDTIGQSVADIQGSVGAVNDQVKAVAGRVDQAASALAAVQGLLDTKLGANLDNVASKAESVRSTAAAIDSTLSALKQVPIVGQLGGDVLDKADAVLTGVQDVAQQVTDLRATVKGIGSAGGQPLVAAIDTVGTSLSRLHSGLGEAQTQLASARDELGAVQSKLPAWEAGLTSAITYGVLLLSVVMLGAAIAMANIFISSLSFFLGRDVLGRWRHG